MYKKILVLTFLTFLFNGCATWEGIKKDSSSLWEVITNKSNDAWSATKETSVETYDATKEKIQEMSK